MRQRLPLILSITALIVAMLGWTGVGEATRNALVPKKNSVGTQHIKNGSIKMEDLAADTQQALRGERGKKGKSGAKGDRGEKGQPGPKGKRGYEGRVGLTGKRGEKGLRGIKGPKGAKGARGISGGGSTFLLEQRLLGKVRDVSFDVSSVESDVSGLESCVNSQFSKIKYGWNSSSWPGIISC